MTTLRDIKIIEALLFASGEPLLEDDLKDRRIGIEGYSESRWILLDYGSVVIHLFDDETREYYSLESLWADATQVDISDLLSAVAAEDTRNQS